MRSWLGREDSNLRMAEPKSARTLGYPPVLAFLSHPCRVATLLYRHGVTPAPPSVPVAVRSTVVAVGSTVVAIRSAVVAVAVRLCIAVAVRSRVVTTVTSVAIVVVRRIVASGEWQEEEQRGKAEPPDEFCGVCHVGFSRSRSRRKHRPDPRLLLGLPSARPW